MSTGAYKIFRLT